MQVATLKTKPAVPTASALARDIMRPWMDAYDSWRSGVAGLLERKETKGDCGCSRCAPDDCRCRCCVADSDLLVETRVGERRVVPITIENHWRRPREIELELSSWTKTSGVQIGGGVVTPKTFTIEPCGEAQVTLVLEIGGATDNAPGQNATAANVAANNQRAPDVTECTVAYADLRVKGCDIRPIRIAVAVLPHHCDNYVVDCRCGCC